MGTRISFLHKTSSRVPLPSETFRSVSLPVSVSSSQPSRLCMAPKHDETIHTRHYPYSNNNISSGTNSAVALSFLVRNPPQYLSSQVNVKAASRSLPPVLSQVLNLPPPTHQCAVQHAGCTSAAPRRSSRMNMSHDTKTSS